MPTYDIEPIGDIPSMTNCIACAVTELGDVQAIIGLNTDGNPTIYVSVNYGENFTETSPTNSNYKGTPVSIDIVSLMYNGLAQNLLVFSIGGYVFKTIFSTIASIMWTSTQINPAYNVGGLSIGSAVVNSQDLYVFANCSNNTNSTQNENDANFFYRSTDSGSTWTQVWTTNTVTGGPTIQYIAAATGTTDSTPSPNVYATGNNGQLWFSGDYGDNWNIIQTITDPSSTTIGYTDPNINDQRTSKPDTLLNKSMTINTDSTGVYSVLSYGTSPTATFISNNNGGTYTIAQSSTGVLLFGNTNPIGVLDKTANYIVTDAYTDQTLTIFKIFNNTNKSAVGFTTPQDTDFNQWTCIDISNYTPNVQNPYGLLGTKTLGAYRLLIF